MEVASKMERNVEVRLAGPTVWRQFLDGGVTRAPSGGPSQALPKSKALEQRLTWAILTQLHDRHVGITPPLADALAQALLSRAPDAFPAPWKAVHERLRDSLHHLASIHEAAGEATEIFPLRFNTSFSFTVFRLAAPLVRIACMEIGESVLFCEDEEAATVTSSAYERYVRSLDAAVERLVQHETALPNLFWQEQALVLAGLSRTRAVHARGNRMQPAIPAPELAVFLGLRPNHEQSHSLPDRDHLPFNRPNLQALYQPDAGTDGIHMTRNPQDFHRMLVSEWFLPEEMRLDRLVNTGFLATKRPPRPVRLRDVLVVGLMPGELNSFPTGIFVKSCWFELLTRMTQLLQRAGLDRSELRWLEGGTSGQIMTQSLLLRELPDMPISSQEKEQDVYRQRFPLLTGWIPSYLDRHTLYERLDDQQARLAEPVWDGEIERWLALAWRAQKEHVRWQRLENGRFRRSTGEARAAGSLFGNTPLDFRQFAHVHLMLLLPSRLFDMAKDERIPSGAAFGHLFDLRAHQNSTISLTTVPQEMTAPDWYFFSPLEREWRLRDEGEEMHMAVFAERLIERWLNAFIKGIQHG